MPMSEQDVRSTLGIAKELPLPTYKYTTRAKQIYLKAFAMSKNSWRLQERSKSNWCILADAVNKYGKGNIRGAVSHEVDYNSI